MSTQPSTSTDTDIAASSSGGVELSIGDFVVDVDDMGDDRDIARVVNIPGVIAREWDIYQTENGEQVTVADTNPQYDPDIQVVVCLFVQQLQTHYPEWDGESPLPLDRVSGDEVTHYAFPVERVQPTEQLDDNPIAPPEELEQLAANLESGAEVALQRDGLTHELHIEKLGIEYRITADGTVIGEGPHTDAFNQKADEFLK